MRSFDIIRPSQKVHNYQPPEANSPKPTSKRSSRQSFYFFILLLIIGFLLFLNWRQPIVEENNQQPIAVTQTPREEQKQEDSNKQPASPAGEQVVSSTENQTPVKQESPSPQPLPAPEKPKIQVLNGARKQGIANQTKIELEKSGWPVTSIGTAKNLYRKTYVYYGKDDYKDESEEIAKVLADHQPILMKSTVVGKYDIMIVIGIK